MADEEIHVHRNLDGHDDERNDGQNAENGQNEGAIGGQVGGQNQGFGVAHINIRVPPFWHEQPHIWFAQLEVQFAIKRITSDLSKYNTVVGSIETKILSQVSDLIMSPPANNKYEALKTLVLERFSDSEHRKIQKLLSQADLGDRRPSQLLNEMKLLASNNGNFSDKALVSIWVQRLPSQMRAIVSASDTDDIRKLAALADKIAEVGDFAHINAVSSQSTSKPTSTIETLEAKINAIMQKFEAFGTTTRGRSQSRNRSHSRSRTNTPANADDSLCWYHQTFKDKAKKCRDGCRLFSNPKNE